MYFTDGEDPQQNGLSDHGQVEFFLMLHKKSKASKEHYTYKRIPVMTQPESPSKHDRNSDCGKVTSATDAFFVPIKKFKILNIRIHLADSISRKKYFKKCSKICFVKPED